MLIFKGAGAVIIFAFALWVIGKERELDKKRSDVSDAAFSFLCFIKSKIECYSMPINRIIEEASGERVLSPLSIGPDEHLYDIFEKNSLYFSPEVRKLLYEFENEFGKLYREGQIERCKYYITLLAAERESERAESAKRSKLCRTLLLCAAAAVVILLW